MFDKKHTACYLLSSFIGSEIYYSFALTPIDLAILLVITRYLDMPKKICCIKQTTLAKEARISERQARNRTRFLFDEKIIFRYMQGKLYHYELGEIITGTVQE